MAELTNRNRFHVTVRKRDDLARHLPFTQMSAARAYIEDLRSQGFKPKGDQLDEHWLVRVRERGHKPLQATFSSLAAAEDFIGQVTVERKRRGIACH
jgi:hypothetical protein